MHLMQNHRDRVTCSSPSRGERSLQAILPRKWNPCFTQQDRKSTRLNSSHGYISYAVFCLKKKKKQCKSNLSGNKRIITNKTCATAYDTLRDVRAFPCKYASSDDTRAVYARRRADRCVHV